MSYLFLFIPAIGWGLMPMFVAGVKKSNIYHQILGTVLGALSLVLQLLSLSVHLLMRLLLF